MPTPDWRAEKSAVLIKQICHVLRQTRARSAATEDIRFTRGDIGLLLWNATKLYCNAREEMNAGTGHTWSPELPEFLLDHPEQCEETLGLVADKNYRDPYYDGLHDRPPGG